MRTVKSATDRRAEILAGATRLFLSRGFDQTTVDDIVTDLGISKGLVFYHFGTKDGLIAAVIEQLAAQVAEPLLAILRAERNVGTKLAQSLRYWAEFAITFRDNFRSLLASREAPTLGRFRDALFTRIAPDLTALTDEGIIDGLIANRDAAHSLTIIAVGSITCLTLGPETLGFNSREFLAAAAQTIELSLQMPPGCITAHLDA